MKKKLLLVILIFLLLFVNTVSGLDTSYRNDLDRQKTIDNLINQQEKLIKNSQDMQQNKESQQQICRNKCFGRPDPTSCQISCNNMYKTTTSISVPTESAQKADELITQMNEELKQAKSNANGIDRELQKINNRNSFEKLQISIFGENPELIRSLRSNIDQADSHILRIQTLKSQCNCIDRSRTITNEVESLNENLNSKYSQAELAIDNKGIINKINKVISNSQK
jgi:hypothetical protein